MIMIRLIFCSCICASAVVMEKYTAYSDDHAQLYDALLSGCSLPFARSTMKHFTEEVERDIRDILAQDPDALLYAGGELRCRNGVTPLAAACFNPNVPLRVVKLLLNHGASPATTIRLNGCEQLLLDDLCDNVSKDRRDRIRVLFQEYSTVNVKPARKTNH